MSAFDDAKTEIEQQLRGSLGALVPGVAEKQWLTDLAADLAREKIRLVTVTTDAERARVAENLEILQATWKLRLAEKELLATQTAQKVIATAISTAVTVAFPGGPVAALAKFAIGAVANGLNGAG